MLGYCIQLSKIDFVKYFLLFEICHPTLENFDQEIIKDSITKKEAAPYFSALPFSLQF